MNPNIKFSLTAIEAKDLMAGDSNGLSDPYFKIPHKQRGVIDLPKKTNRTKTIMKTCLGTPPQCFDLIIQTNSFYIMVPDAEVSSLSSKNKYFYSNSTKSYSLFPICNWTAASII